MNLIQLAKTVGGFKQPVGLLFSGGFDSTMMAYLLGYAAAETRGAGKIRLIHFNTQCRNSELELRFVELAVHKLSETFGDQRFQLIVDKSLNLGLVEDPQTFYVDARNALFAIRGFSYAPVVILGATASDIGRDKDETFAQLTTALLQYVNVVPRINMERVDPKELNADEWRTQPQVLVPFAEYSKIDLAIECARHEVPADALLDSVSCYASYSLDTEGSLGCMDCAACFQKALALQAYFETFGAELKSSGNMRAYSVFQEHIAPMLWDGAISDQVAWIDAIRAHTWTPAVAQLYKYSRTSSRSVTN